MAPTPERVPGHDKPKPGKPDPRPMRIALGAGGLAAMSALVAAIVAPPRPDAVILPGPAAAADPNGHVVSDPGATPAPVQVQRQIKYVQLQPGQTAPPGATVIPATAPTPITVVISVPGGGGGGGGTTAAKPAPKPTPIIIKTTQSGKVIP